MIQYVYLITSLCQPTYSVACVQNRNNNITSNPLCNSGWDPQYYTQCRAIQPFFPRTTTMIVGWFTGCKYKNHNKWDSKPPKLCDFYSVYIYNLQMWPLKTNLASHRLVTTPFMHALFPSFLYVVFHHNYFFSMMFENWCKHKSYLLH
jgi:hypothetical protein